MHDLWWGINGYKYKRVINWCKKLWTLGRLILGFLINSPFSIKLIGDKSLSKRDFKRISDPLSKFDKKFKLNKNKNLPLSIFGSQNLKSFNYIEKRGSAKCKSAVIFGGIRAQGKTIIKAKKSRNHTELLCKYLKLPISVKRKKNYDFITIKNVNNIKKINYNIPSDISSSSFFIVLTTLSKDSELVIKNVNINSSRKGL